MHDGSSFVRGDIFMVKHDMNNTDNDKSNNIVMTVWQAVKVVNIVL